MATGKGIYLTDYHSLEDHLNFSDFSPTLVDILINADTPLTVGVFGPWGSGKSSLMHQLRYLIEAKKLNSLRTVWITAWKYDRHEALWRVFILRVLDALYPRKDGKGPREEWPRFTEEELTDKNQQELVAELDRLEESVYHPVDWQELGQLTVNWWQVLKEGGKGAAELMAAFLPGGGLFRNALTALVGDKKADGQIDNLDNIARAFKREVKAYHRDQLVHMEQFENTFAHSLKKALGEDGRLIVFVDDLDRCLPEKAVEVLEAIKLFLEVKGAVFVLGMDKDVLERGVEARYRAFFAGREGAGDRYELPISGEAYLQKMVQIPFYLPPIRIEDIGGYIKKLEGQLPSEERTSSTTRAVLARGLFPNPRQVKRVLNIFRLVRGIVLAREQRPAKEGGLEQGKIAWPLLAKTILIQTQWPSLYHDWKLYPSLIQQLELAYSSHPTSEKDIILGKSSFEEKQASTSVTVVQPGARSLLGQKN